MLYLLLAILCSSSIALIFKFSEGRSLNRLAVTSSNYFIASLVSFFMAFKGSYNFTNPASSIKDFASQFTTVLVKNNGTFNENGSLLWAVLLGILTGIFFFLSFIYYQKSVGKNGAGLSGTFGKLGILVPMLFSVIVWHEYPSLLQWFGISIALFAIVYVNLGQSGSSIKNINVTLLLLFFFGGMSEFSNKLFQKYSLLQMKDLFLLFVFLTAFLISLFFTIRNLRRPSFTDILTGFCVGIPNLFSSYFLILALGTVKASLAFPIYSSGSIIVISAGSYMLYKETPRRKEKLSMLLILIALIILNS